MDVVEPAPPEPTPPPGEARPALSDLIEGFSRHVRSVARCWRVPSRDLDDVSQEAFFRAHRALPRYRPHAAGPKPWLTKITIRAAQDHLRRSALREALTDDGTMEEMMDQKPSAEDLARYAQAERIACTIMRGLPEDLRLVYQLHLDGADEAYIAELAELPRTTVHTRLHRARNKVEALVAELHRNEERRAGAASPMLSILASPAALFGAAQKVPSDPADAERLFAALAKKIGLASAGVLASLPALYVAAIGAAIFLLGTGTGITIARAAKPEASTTIATSEPAREASMEAPALVSANAAPPDVRAEGSALADATAARPNGPSGLGVEQAKLDLAIAALNAREPKKAKALLAEHARLYPSSRLQEARRELLQRANAALGE